MKKLGLPIILVLLLLILVNGLYTIREDQQAIIVQFGRPVGDAITDAGLHFKIPLIQTLIKFEKRVLEWDGAKSEIPTKDNKYIFIDTFARWKISDALQFYKSAKNEMLAQSRLDDIIDGAVRDEISNRVMEEIIRSTERVMVMHESDSEDKHFEEGKKKEQLAAGARIEIMTAIYEKVKLKMEELGLGITVLDVQIKRVNYNEQVQQKLFNRMISDQERIAEKYRAQGQGSKAEIHGKQIQRKKEILSEAYLQSQKIRGQADADAIKIYADTYGRDREFYGFIKTLETYKNTIDSSTKLILSTESEYLKYLGE